MMRWRKKIMKKEWQDVEEELFKALNAPGCIRLWLIKKIYPEIANVANTLRSFYWSSSSRAGPDGVVVGTCHRCHRNEKAVRL